MPPRLPFTVAGLASVLLTGSIAASQPIEPLGATRPAAPPAPADVAEAPADATKTASGVAWKVLAKPKGTIHPGAHDKVTINFTGWSPDGAVIASSIPDGEPWALVMDDVLPGLGEGLRLMAKGEMRRLWIPAALAATGRRFRDTVLALGGSRPPAEVFEAFRGRGPSVGPLLRQNGLQAPGPG